MILKSNKLQKLEKTADRQQHFGIRKLTIGAASVLLGTTLWLGRDAMNVQAADQANDAKEGSNDADQATESKVETPKIDSKTQVEVEAQPAGKISAPSNGAVSASSAQTNAGIKADTETQQNASQKQNNTNSSSATGKVNAENKTQATPAQRADIALNKAAAANQKAANERQAANNTTSANEIQGIAQAANQTANDSQVKKFDFNKLDLSQGINQAGLKADSNLGAKSLLANLTTEKAANSNKDIVAQNNTTDSKNVDSNESIGSLINGANAADNGGKAADVEIKKVVVQKADQKNAKDLLVQGDAALKAKSALMEAGKNAAYQTFTLGKSSFSNPISSNQIGVLLATYPNGGGDIEPNAMKGGTGWQYTSKSGVTFADDPLYPTDNIIPQNQYVYWKFHDNDNSGQYIYITTDRDYTPSSENKTGNNVYYYVVKDGSLVDHRDLTKDKTIGVGRLGALTLSYYKISGSKPVGVGVYAAADNNDIIHVDYGPGTAQASEGVTNNYGSYVPRATPITIEYIDKDTGQKIADDVTEYGLDHEYYFADGAIPNNIGSYTKVGLAAGSAPADGILDARKKDYTYISGDGLYMYKRTVTDDIGTENIIKYQNNGNGWQQIGTATGVAPEDSWQKVSFNNGDKDWMIIPTSHGQQKIVVEYENGSTPTPEIETAKIKYVDDDNGGNEINGTSENDADQQVSGQSSDSVSFSDTIFNHIKNSGNYVYDHTGDRVAGGSETIIGTKDAGFNGINWPKFGDQTQEIIVHFKEKSKTPPTTPSNEQAANIKVIDENNNNQLAYDQIEGKAGSLISFDGMGNTVRNYINNGYVWDHAYEGSIELPVTNYAGIDFGNFDSDDNTTQNWTIYLKHGSTTKTENGTTNATVHYVVLGNDPDKPAAPDDNQQTIDWTRTDTVDAVTNQVTQEGRWTPDKNSFNDVPTPTPTRLADYTPSQTNVSFATPVYGHDQVVTVFYTKNPAEIDNANIKVVDEDENNEVLAHSAIQGGDGTNIVFNGMSDTVQGYLNHNYLWDGVSEGDSTTKLPNISGYSDIKFGKFDKNNKNQSWTIYLRHSYTPVNPDHPDDKDGYTKDYLDRKITRTVNYYDADNNNARMTQITNNPKTQTTEFKGSGYLDNVTHEWVIVQNGKISGSSAGLNWTPSTNQTFNNIAAQPVDGYHIVSITGNNDSTYTVGQDGAIGEENVTKDTPSSEVDIYYRRNSNTPTPTPSVQNAGLRIIDQTENNEVLNTYNDSGKSTDTITFNGYSPDVITNYIKRGYVVVGLTNDNNSAVDAAMNGTDSTKWSFGKYDNKDGVSQDFTITLKHGIGTVDQKHPGNGYTADQLQKTVTTDIKYVDDSNNGAEMTGMPEVKETVTFNGSGIYDKVTGNWVTKDPTTGKWTTKDPTTGQTITGPSWTYSVTGVQGITGGNGASVTLPTIGAKTVPSDYEYKGVDGTSSDIGVNQGNGSFGAQTVTRSTGDSALVVHFNKKNSSAPTQNPQAANITVIDEDNSNSQLAFDQIIGKANDNISFDTVGQMVNNLINNGGYEFDYANEGTGIDDTTQTRLDAKDYAGIKFGTFDDKDNTIQNWTIYLKHKIGTVNHTTPGNGYTAEQLQHTVKTDITYVNDDNLDAHGNPQPMSGMKPVQEVVIINGSGNYDEVTHAWVIKDPTTGKWTTKDPTTGQTITGPSWTYSVTGEPGKADVANQSGDSVTLAPIAAKNAPDGFVYKGVTGTSDPKLTVDQKDGSFGKEPVNRSTTNSILVVHYGKKPSNPNPGTNEQAANITVIDEDNGNSQLAFDQISGNSGSAISFGNMGQVVDDFVNKDGYKWDYVNQGEGLDDTTQTKLDGVNNYSQINFGKFDDKDNTIQNWTIYLKHQVGHVDHNNSGNGVTADQLEHKVTTDITYFNDDTKKAMDGMTPVHEVVTIDGFGYYDKVTHNWVTVDNDKDRNITGQAKNGLTWTYSVKGEPGVADVTNQSGDNVTLNAIGAKTADGYTYKGVTGMSDPNLSIDQSNGSFGTQKVDRSSANSNLVVHYSKKPSNPNPGTNEQAANITIIDEDNGNSQLAFDQISGNSGSAISFGNMGKIVDDLVNKDGYKWDYVSEGTGTNDTTQTKLDAKDYTGIKFGNFDSNDNTTQNWTIYLKHQVGHVDHNNPGNGYTSEQLEHKVTNDITYFDDDNNKAMVGMTPVHETVTIDGSGYYDKVTHNWVTVDSTTGKLTKADGLTWTYSINGKAAQPGDHTTLDAIPAQIIPAGYKNYEYKGITGTSDPYLPVNQKDGSFGEEPVNRSTTNSTLVVHYGSKPKTSTSTPSAQNAGLRIIDQSENNEVLNTYNDSGKSADAINFNGYSADVINNYIKRGYVVVGLTNDNNSAINAAMYGTDPTKWSFGKYDNKDNVSQNFTITLKHGITHVDHDHPGNGYSADQLQHTVTTKVTYVDEGGNSVGISLVNNTVTITGQGDYDNVTKQWVIVKNGKITGTAQGPTWIYSVNGGAPQNGDHTTLPEIPAQNPKNYTYKYTSGSWDSNLGVNTSDGSIAQQTVNLSSIDSNIIIHFSKNNGNTPTTTPNSQVANITVVDEDNGNNQLAYDQINGKAGTDISFGNMNNIVQNYLNNGYKWDYVNQGEGQDDKTQTMLNATSYDQINFGTFDNKDNTTQNWTIYLRHRTTHVDHDHPGNGYTADQLQHTVKTDITYVDDDHDGQPMQGMTAVHEVITINGSGDYDNVNHNWVTKDPTTGKLTKVDGPTWTYSVTGEPGVADVTNQSGDHVTLNPIPAQTIPTSYKNYEYKSVSGISDPQLTVNQKDGSFSKELVNRSSANSTLVVHYGKKNQTPKPSKEQGSVTINVHDDTINQDLPNYGYKTGTVDEGTTVNYANHDAQMTDLTNKGYVIVSDPCADGTVAKTVPGNDNLVYTIHVKHGIQPVTPDNKPGTSVVPNQPNGPKYPDTYKTTDLQKQVTRTIEYVDQNGKQVANPFTSTVNFTGTRYFDEVTGQWTDANGNALKDQSNPTTIWSAAQTLEGQKSPVVPGYYLVGVDKTTEQHNDSKDGVNVDDVTVDHTVSDYTVKVVYSPVGKIVPVDPKGNPIPNVPNPPYTNNPTDPKNVQPNEPVPTIPGYHLQPSQPNRDVNPGNGTNGTVTPSQPGKDTQVVYVPDAPTTDTGTVTVKVHDNTIGKDIPSYNWTSNVNGKPQNVGTKITYDKAKTITDLTNQGYKVINPDVEIPSTISQGTNNVTIYVEHNIIPVNPQHPGNPGEPVDPNNPNGPTYPKNYDAKALAHDVTRKITFVDQNGKQLRNPVAQTVHFTAQGRYDEVTHSWVDQNGKALADQNNPFTWSPDQQVSGMDPQSLIEQGYHIVSIDKDTDAAHNEILTKTLNHGDQDYTVNVVYAQNGKIVPVDPNNNNQPIPDAPQPVLPTDPNDPTKVDNGQKPSVPGYKPQTGNPGDPVQPAANPSDNVNVPYVKNPNAIPVQGSVTYYDQTTGNNIEVDPISGNVGDKITYTTADKIKKLEDQGYEFVSNNFTDGQETFAKDGNKFVVTLKHGSETINPNNPGNPGQPINPNDPNGPKWGADTDQSHLQVVGKQIVHYTGAGTATPKDVENDVYFNHEEVIDKVTGTVLKDNGWTVSTDKDGKNIVAHEDSYGFTAIPTPAIDGYTADKTSAGQGTISHTNPTIEETVTYTKNSPVSPDQPGRPTNPPQPTSQPTSASQPTTASQPTNASQPSQASQPTQASQASTPDEPDEPDEPDDDEPDGPDEPDMPSGHHRTHHSSSSTPRPAGYNYNNGPHGERGYSYNNRPIGQTLPNGDRVLPNGEVVDANGNVVGYLDANGNFISNSENSNSTLPQTGESASEEIAEAVAGGMAVSIGLIGLAGVKKKRRA